MKSNKRNETTDIARGLAIIMVMVGHIISTSTIGYEKSVVYNIIWSIQMPLFMIISGYVTRYSGEISSKKELLHMVKKRSISYLVPWFIWGIVIKGLILNQLGIREVYYYFLKLLWNMDNSYWFLFSIWSISMLFLIAKIISNKYGKNLNEKVLITCICTIIGSIGLLAIGLMTSLSFLGIKLTVYYLPFFIVGYIYGQYQDILLKKDWYARSFDIVIGICTCVYFYIITNHNLFVVEDSIMNICIRIIAAITGSVIVFNAVLKWVIKCERITNVFKLAGKKSLELYVAHYMFLSIIEPTIKPTLQSIEGVALVGTNLCLMSAALVIVINILDSNNYLRTLVFGRK